jgi:hypothetical protein
MSNPKPIPIAQLQGLLVGIPKYCASTIFYVAGQAITATQAVTLINSVLNASAASTAARAAWTEARQAEEKTLAETVQVVREIRDTVGLMFSTVPTTLSAFAIPQRKAPKPLSTEARAAATAKLRATREARGTTSKTQKDTISGNVTGVTITPVTAPTAAPAASPPAASSPATPATSSGQPAATAVTATHS